MLYNKRWKSAQTNLLKACAVLDSCQAIYFLEKKAHLSFFIHKKVQNSIVLNLNRPIHICKVNRTGTGYQEPGLQMDPGIVCNAEKLTIPLKI